MSDIVQQIPLPGGDLTYYPGWLAGERSKLLFNRLLADLKWQQPTITIAGKQIKIPRKQVWMGDDNSVMRYSGTSFCPEVWHPLVLNVKQALTCFIKVQFNSVLLNLYRDGQDSVSWHADDEPELGDNPIIASVSLGASRKFSIKPKKQKQKPLHLVLNDGDLLVMQGATQHHWLHCVPKEKQMPISETSGSQRINLTFRYIKP